MVQTQTLCFPTFGLFNISFSILVKHWFLRWNITGSDIKVEKCWYWWQRCFQLSDAVCVKSNQMRLFLFVSAFEWIIFTVSKLNVCFCSSDPGWVLVCWWGHRKSILIIWHHSNAAALIIVLSHLICLIVTVLLMWKQTWASRRDSFWQLLELFDQQEL